MTTHPFRLLASLLLIALLHAAIVALLMRHRTETEAPRPRGDAVQWLLAPALPARPATEPPRLALRPPHAASQAVRGGKGGKADKVVNAAAPIKPVRPVTQDQTPPGVDLAIALPPPPDAVANAPLPDDPFAEPPAKKAPTASEIIALARRDVGKIDRELRKAYPESAPLAPADSKQAVLERGFNAAYDAAPPKWYQGAKMVELSTPDGENRTRTYKIITALVSYCITISPAGKKKYTNCPP